MTTSGDSKDDQLLSLFDKAFDGNSSENDLDSPLFETLNVIEKRYLNSEEINAGGMKKIYRTFDSIAGRYIAMAKLHEGAAKEFYDPFICEARLTGLLEHPNIMTIHDLGVDEDGTPFFTMELKQGDDLSDILRELDNGDDAYTQKYSLTHLLEIFLKICDGISYAHSKGVIHLDLKPSNIQVGEFGEVLVCDWGLGKIIGGAEISAEAELFNADWLNSMTLTGQVKGTPGYMAPEQIVDDAQKNEKTDIYSLGCLLYSLLTYRRPIEGETDDVLTKTATGDILEPIQRFPEKGISQSLNAVVMKATALVQEDRYQSVSELRKEVYNYLAGFATSAENASIFKGLQLLYKRNKVICQLSLFFVIILVLLTGQFVYDLNRTTESAIAAREEAVEAQTEAERLLLEKENVLKRVQALNAQRSLIKEAIFEKISYVDPVQSIRKKISDFENRKPSRSRFHILSEYYYIAQEFEKLYDFNKADERPSFLFNKAKKFKGLPKNSERIIALPDFLIAIKVLDQRNRAILDKMVAYDVNLRTDLSGYEVVIEYLLSVWNNGLKNSTFDYDAEKRSLKLSGADFKILGTEGMRNGRKSLLWPLDLKYLDIRNTQIHDLNQLRGLNSLVRLDLRRTLVSDLKPLSELKSLKSVIISKKQFPQKQLDEIKDEIFIDLR